MSTFKPTKDMINAAKQVFQAMAAVELIEPVVHAYQTKVLLSQPWEILEEWRVEIPNRPTQTHMTKHDEAFLLSEADQEKYFNLCRIERANAGFYVEHPDHCPLVVSKKLLKEAHKELCREMQSITGLSYDRIYLRDAIFKQYIENTLKLLAPFVKV